MFALILYYACVIGNKSDVPKDVGWVPSVVINQMKVIILVMLMLLVSWKQFEKIEIEIMN